MENKIYMLLTRNNVGAYTGKAVVCADLYLSSIMLSAMMRASPKNTRAEIIEGDRDYIMDFRVKPLIKFRLDEYGEMVEENNL